MDSDRERLGPLYDHPWSLVLLRRFGTEEKRTLSADALLRADLSHDRLVAGGGVFGGIFRDRKILR